VSDLDVIFVSHVKQIVCKGDPSIVVVFDKVLDEDGGLVQVVSILEIDDLNVVAHLVSLLSLEDEEVEADSPLLDLIFKRDLKGLPASSVPYLEQEVTSIVELFDAFIDFHLDRQEEHVFVVDTGAVHSVKSLKIELVGAVLQVLVCISLSLLDVRDIVSFF